MDLHKETLKCKADRTAVKRCILLSPIFQVEDFILHQGYKMLSEDGNKRLQYLSGSNLGESGMFALFYDACTDTLIQACNRE